MKGRWIALVLVLAATVAAYAPGLRGGFMLDDFGTIHPIAAMQSAGASVAEAVRAAPHQVRARWISNATFALTNVAGGTPAQPDPFAYKLGNLLIHLATVAALFALATAVAAASGAALVQARWTAMCAASLFALHPLLASTVLYPVQRMAQLSTLFLVLCLHAYVRWRASLPGPGQGAHVVRLLLIAGLAGLSFFSKETGALAPLLILVAELSLFRWPARSDPARPRFEQGFGLLCVVPLVLGATMALVRWKDVLVGYRIRDFTVVERLLTQVHAVASYLGQIVFPRVGDMALYHDDFPITSSLDASTVAWVGVFVVIAAGAWAMRRRAPLVAFGVLWFFAAHAMESTVVPLELYYEHRNYLAMVGPAIAMAAALGALRNQRLAAAIAMSMLAFFAASTARRSYEWRDYATWLGTESTRHPRSLRAATDLFALHLQTGEPGPAAAMAERLAAARPTSAHPVLLRLGVACATPSGRMVPSADDLEKLATLKVDKDLFHSYRGLLSMRLGGRCQETSWDAFARVAGAVASNAGLGADVSAVAAWHREAAHAWVRHEDWRAAAEHLEPLLRARDDDPRDWLLLARARAVLGDRTGFVQARQRAQRLPGVPAEVFAELDGFAAKQLPDER